MFTGRRFAGTVVTSAPSQKETTGVRRLESRDHPQRRRLAAAARSEQREELALDDLERDVVHRKRAAEALADARKRNRDPSARHHGQV